MALQKRHKIIIGGLGSLVIVFMIFMSVFVYMIFVRQNIQYNNLDKKIDDVETGVNVKINELATSVLDAESELKSLGAQVGSIDEDMNSLKASASADFSGIIEDAIKSVVTIRTDVSQGSGFIIDSEGYVVTNYHVMQGAKAAGIITYDGEMHAVTSIGKDETMDIALLKIEGTYTSIELADSDEIQIGEKVIAIGNPLGLQFSVSEGIVSAIHREGINGLDAYIQTDAALNPGNSGGPLINNKGKVLGINNFKIGDSESLGFALESNWIKDTVNDISQLALGKDLI